MGAISKITITDLAKEDAVKTVKRTLIDLYGENGLRESDFDILDNGEKANIYVWEKAAIPEVDLPEKFFLTISSAIPECAYESEVLIEDSVSGELCDFKATLKDGEVKIQMSDWYGEVIIGDMSYEEFCDQLGIK